MANQHFRLPLILRQFLGLVIWLIAGVISRPVYAGGLPPEIPETSRAVVAGANNCTLITIDAPTKGLLLIPKDVRSNSDTRYHRAYRSAIHVYVSGKGLPDGPADGYIERFIVYGTEPAATPFMVSAAKLLLILWGEAWGHFHRDHPVDTPVVQVWMDPLKAPGLSADVAGEQFKNQIYFYSILTERRPIEWCREIAHEYGHFSLPGISGYTEPEEWANGVLGERLYTNWLQQDVKAGKVKPTELPIVSPADLDEYAAKQIVPVITLIRDGVTREAMRRKDTIGMDTYTGLALWIDSIYGSQQLFSAMSYTVPKSAGLLSEGEDFLDGYIQSMKNTEKQELTISPLVALPDRATCTVYLEPGTYRLVARPATTAWQAQLRSISIKGTASETALRVPAAGWYRLQLHFASPLSEPAAVSIIKSPTQ